MTNSEIIYELKQKLKEAEDEIKIASTYDQEYLMGNIHGLTEAIELLEGNHEANNAV